MSRVEGTHSAATFDPAAVGNAGGMCREEAATDADRTPPWMRDTVEVAQKKPLMTKDPRAHARPSAGHAEIARAAATASLVRGGTEILVKEAAQSVGASASAAGRIGSAGAGLLGFAEHYFGDTPVAQTALGHGAVSALKAIGDVAISAGIEDALGEIVKPRARAVARGWSVAGTVAGTVDRYLDADHPAKLFTSFAKDANAAAVIEGGMGAAADGAAVVGSFASGNEAAAFRGAEVMEQSAIDGKYSPVVQSLTAGLAVAKDDVRVQEQFTDRAARSGERGTLLAVGNYIADGGDPTAGSRQGEIVPWDEDAKKMAAMKWYKPWTW